MSSNPDENGSAACQRIEDFIFVRELNEVFLLLDHISGRWDKSLYNFHNHDDGEPHIDELCAIGLAPPGSDEQRVAQAVKVLCAKNKLNAAARPATGLTIAFTLLVVGEGTLALLQLALGATIGACIALFVNPSGQTPGSEIGLLGNWALSTSALSFTAGFGVEGVFVALESLVRRVFNISDPARRSSEN